MALTGTLTDSFAVNDLATLWAASYGGLTVSGGQCVMPCTSGYSGLQSAGLYALTSSAARLRAIPYTGVASAQMYLRCQLDASNHVDLGYDTASLTASLTQGGSVSFTSSVAYSASAHAWWRIRETAGVIYFGAAADGLNWTDLWSAPYAMSLAGLQVQVFTGHYAAGADGTSFAASFNITPAGNLLNPPWQAARAGMPGDVTAASDASEVGQLLASHGVRPVYAGTQVITPAGVAAAETDSLLAHDIDQPFVMPAGKTTVGRVTLPLSPAGNGADVTVSLCADSAGAPGTVITSARLPASWLAQLAAPDGLDAAGPLGTAQANTMAFTFGTTSAWTQPAVSLNGSGNYAVPVTSGGYTVLLGGYDTVAAGPIATVATVQYQGGGVISGPMPQPPLPKASFFGAACATADTLVFAGGAGAAALASVWTASWDPSTGTAGAWTAQASLPQATMSGAMAAWGSTAYFVGGNTSNTTATAVASVWYASAASGQITSWTAGPPLPQPLSSPYAAVVGDWLIVAGGQNPAGTALTACYYAAVSADGSLGAWRAGPPLQDAACAFAPSWNLAVTDSAMVITTGTTTGLGTVPLAQVLTVTADGPAASWTAQSGYSPGVYQSAAFQDGSAGEWQVISMHLTSYDDVPLIPLPLVSVPLPATGLTPGATYHVLLHQDGGDLNDLVLANLIASALPSAAQRRAAGGGAWTPTGSFSLPVGVWDGSPGGPVLHTWEDSGARITYVLRAGASAQVLGLCEATQFGDGTMIAPVTQVTYSGSVPAGTVQLA